MAEEGRYIYCITDADGRVRAGADAEKAMLGTQLKGKVARAEKEPEEAEAETAGDPGEDGSREVDW